MERRHGARPTRRFRTPGNARWFAFQLARDLGMTVGQLIDTMDSAEFLDWQTLARIEADEAEQAERGGRGEPARRRPVTDPAEIAAWFSRN